MKDERIEQIFSEYRRTFKKPSVTLREAVEWAYRMKLLVFEDEDVIRHFIDEFSSSLGRKNFIDPKGRKVSSYYVAPSPQGNLWGDKDAPRPFMEVALKNKRRGIRDDCYQLKMDTDSYNDRHPNEEKIVMQYDFTKDMLEMDRERRKPTRKLKGYQRSKPTQAPVPGQDQQRPSSSI